MPAIPALERLRQEGYTSNLDHVTRPYLRDILKDVYLLKYIEPQQGSAGLPLVQESFLWHLPVGPGPSPTHGPIGQLLWWKAILARNSSLPGTLGIHAASLHTSPLQLPGPFPSSMIGEVS